MRLSFLPNFALAVVLLGSVNQTQTANWWSVSIPLPMFSTPYMLVELTVSKPGVPALLTANANTPPLATYDDILGLQITALAADIVSFAYRSTHCYLTLNASSFPASGSLEIGILMPDLQSTASLQLTVRSHGNLHSDGELCPGDCNDHGQCSSSTCECSESFVGEDCGFATSQVVANQQADLVVAAYAYSLLEVLYDHSRNLGLSMKIVQGEVILLVAFGL